MTHKRKWYLGFQTSSSKHTDLHVNYTSTIRDTIGIHVTETSSTSVPKTFYAMFRLARLKTSFLIVVIISSVKIYFNGYGPDSFETNGLDYGGHNEDIIFRYLPEQTFIRHSEVEGYLFSDECIAVVYIGQIQSALLLNLSPFIVRETHRRFLDISGNTNHCVMSPAVEQMHGKIIIAYRIFRCYPWGESLFRQFQQDLVYLQEYNQELIPIGPGYFIAYGYPKMKILNDGPQDPRAFKFRGRLYLFIHAGVQIDPMIRPILWDVEANRPILLIVKDNVFGTKLEAGADKNWMALVLDDTLYFVQYLDPLLVVKCELNGTCEYVHNLPLSPFDANITGAIDPYWDVLHGGTPFKHYSDNYYIGLIHGKYKKNAPKYLVSAYTSHIILFNTNTFRVVFLSGHIPLNPELYRGRPRPEYTLLSFYFPVSVVVESRDSLLVFAHVNDNSSFMLRISGIEGMLRDVMKKDKTDPAENGPPVGCMQESLWTRKATYTKLQTAIN